MAVTMKQLGIDKLSIEDRLALLDEIWESVAPARENQPLTEEQKELFAARMADMKNNPDNVLTWEEIQESIRGKP